MRLNLFLLGLMLVSQSATSIQCISGGQDLDVSECRSGVLCVLGDSGESILEEGLDNIEGIHCLDVNFDDEPDVVVSHPPSGQVKMSSVYIFDKTDGAYKKSEEISSLPCLEINSKKKRIAGACFSSSVCDHWSEQYRFTEGALELVSMKGTYCDPTTGDAYSYFEKYEAGKVVEKVVNKLTEDK